MVLEALVLLLVLAGLTAAFTLLAERITIPDPVLLAAVGILLSFVRVFPSIKLNPELVLLAILPPLVYSSAVELSWEEFRGNARPISLFAVGLVAVTSTVVAAVAHLWIPNLGWAEALMLGAIVSPTDPVASTALSRSLGLPRRLVAITEGEGLVNDAVALTLLKLATAAALAHSFSIGAGLGRFAAIVVGETIYGTVVGWVAARIRRHIFEARVEMTVSLMTPFVAYLVPQQLGGSGVLATLFAGMYIGIQAPELIPSDIRLSLAGTWSTLVYLLQGSLFLLTGLQFRSVIQGERHPAGLVYGAVITAVVVIIRLLWTWPAMWITDRFSAGTHEARLPNRQVFFLAWCGMRGGISLAAALSLAPEIASRNLITFITACVIAGTLIVQGGPLPWIIQKLKLDQDAHKEHGLSLELERKARMAAIRAALNTLEPCGDEGAHIREEYCHRLETLDRGASEEVDMSPSGYRENHMRMALDAIGTERQTVIKIHRDGDLPENVLHRIERDIDLREVRLRQLLSATD